ncbi:5840_t:CDS:2 [Funneliformis caledonium]|uniref:5840_t:CDS:1 n=1 Tax=Funneliformis caledonium TaxID=1117310 RepID=A0A9N9IR51_9GLOM|nr:5840_t:CDS:2 [Funneliformis caledonium]
MVFLYDLIQKLKVTEAFSTVLVRNRNGHSLRPIEKDSYMTIATQMPFQLLEEKLDTVIARYELTSYGDVLNLVVKYENEELENATIILIIDGMQNMIESLLDN